MVNSGGADKQVAHGARRGIRVGLTGGIASGKSTVSRLLEAKGALVIDADQLARAVVEPGTEGLRQVVEAFGPDLVDDAGRLDRARLGALVFGDPARRVRLEQIVHPLVRTEAARLEAEAGADQVVVHDIPLLVETGQQGDFDLVVVVDATPATQVERLVRERGMSADAAGQRIAAQAAREERRSAADEVILNDGSLDDLQAAVDRVWRRVDALRGQDPKQNPR
jgi:dephospho-CoA kinase